MAAADFTALVERIREVLTEGAAGTIRRCPPKGTFRWSTGRVEARELPPSAGDTPTVCVELIEIREAPDAPADELSNWHLYDVELAIDVVYRHGGGNYLRPPDGGDRHSLGPRAGNDMHLLIRPAVCAPNVMDRSDRLGADTGVVEFIYRRSGMEWLDSTLVARHVFDVKVQIEAPT